MNCATHRWEHSGRFPQGDGASTTDICSRCHRRRDTITDAAGDVLNVHYYGGGVRGCVKFPNDPERKGHGPPHST